MNGCLTEFLDIGDFKEVKMSMEELGGGDAVWSDLLKIALSQVWEAKESMRLTQPPSEHDTRRCRDRSSSRGRRRRQRECSGAPGQHGGDRYRCRFQAGGHHTQLPPGTARRPTWRYAC